MPLPDPVSGGLMAGGQLIGALGQASAARRQNRILSGGIREQNRAGMESAGTMADFLAQLRGSAPNPGAERGAFTGAIGPGAVSGPMTASSRFKADAAGATANARGYGGTLADLFARIRAPALQRQNENELLVRAGDALRPIQMRSQDSDYLINLRAGMVKPDPWTQLLGQGLSSVGSYYLGQRK